jgi:large subunit ribosomal protein L25
VADTALSAEYREATGKGSARKLRARGRIPATDPRALERLIQQSDAGRNTLIDLKVAGRDDVVVIVKELQIDPVQGDLLHADFNVVDLEKTIQVSVPVQLMGIPSGVSQGLGILDHTLREIEIECLPRAIPDAIEVDVSALEIDQSIHVADLAAPEGSMILSDGSLSVVSVVAPRAVEEEVAAPEEEEAVEGAEPGVEKEAAEEKTGGEEEAKKKERGE